MKINIDIICENLKDSLSLEVRGRKSKKLTLRRIEFFEPSEDLSEDILYLACGDKLGEYRRDFSGMSIACVGQIPEWVNSQHDCVILVINNQSSIIDVFRAMSKIFFRYDAWEEALFVALRSSSDLLEFISLSVPIFGNPMQISDNQYNLLAYTRIEKHNGARIDSFTVGAKKTTATPDVLKILTNEHPKDQNRKIPYFYRDGRYCINLFLDGRFAGNIQLIPSIKPLSEIDLALFEYLSFFIVDAMKKYTKIGSKHVHTRKNIFKSLLGHKLIHPNWLHQISKSREGTTDRYVCIRLQLCGDSHALPYEAICQSLEMVLPDCVAFEHDNVIAAFLSTVDCPHKFGGWVQILEDYLENLNFVAGISDEFEDIQNARHYFQQAACAVEAGIETDLNKRYYRFSDYALQYCLKNASGNMEAQFLCPRGLVMLREHDDAFSGNYWKTLEAYLDNKMNVTQTAKKLYLHRSTVLQKIDRIDAILNVDLDVPDMRLYVRLCMKMIDMAAED